MKTIVGVFNSRVRAECATEDLRAIGVANDNINMLIPGMSKDALEAVPTTETEQPAMGKVIGGVVGGALGAAGGMGEGTAAASLLVPGIGPVIAIRLLGTALLGTGGVIGGAAAGQALEESLDDGMPRDELFVYEDALRKGRTVVIALVEDNRQADAARKALTRAGAESIDAARESWWIGLRDVEKEDYKVHGGDFETDELSYRRGFEAALRLETRGKSYSDVIEYLMAYYPDVWGRASFHRGYERGQACYQELQEKFLKDISLL